MTASAIKRCSTLAVALLAALLGSMAATQAFDPSALWKIVNGQCVPNEQQHGNPTPCVEVELGKGLARGYAVLKDRVGTSQYLLLPTTRITGIETPALLAPDAENYFDDAWNARGFVEKAVGHELPIDTLGLAVNSSLARTQNQLHIHIDCVLPGVHTALMQLRSTIGDAWAPLKEPVGGYDYQAMRVMGTTLAGHNPFTLLAQGVPGSRADMALRTLVVVGMRFGADAPGFVILEDRADPLHFDFAAGARLLDHDCALAR